VAQDIGANMRIIGLPVSSSAVIGTRSYAGDVISGSKRTLAPVHFGQGNPGR